MENFLIFATVMTACCAGVTLGSLTIIVMAIEWLDERREAKGD